MGHSRHHHARDHHHYGHSHIPHGHRVGSLAENQMKTDAAKFAADMDAATVNAGSFLQTGDRSAEDDSKPSSLAEMGETTALDEWRKRMEGRQRQVKETRDEQERLLSTFHPLSFLETGSKDIGDFA